MPLPSARQMINQLISIPSVSSVSPQFDMSNRAVIDTLATWLDELGFSIEIQELSNPDKANLIARLGPERDDGLIFSGHTDTVPWDEDHWTSDPFSATERDGKLYGLGTADMKSFLALAIDAARDLNASTLQKPLILLATCDEESSMDGARALVDRGQRLGAYAVIGEPTSLRPIRMHKGIFMDRVQLTGSAGHSSNPAWGNSALEGMNTVISAILKWREQLQSKHYNDAFEVPVPTLNLGHIQGGDNPNRICGHCELHYDLRSLPGMDNDQLRASLKQHLTTTLQGSELELAMDTLFYGIPAFETPADSAIVLACAEHTGNRAGAVAFGTEGPFLNQLGIETVICGPGRIDQAHQADEYLQLDQLPSCTGLLKNLTKQFCL